MTAKLSVPKSVSDNARDLLERLLVRDPEERLTEPEEIKAHPFFCPIDWDKLFAKELEPPYKPPVKGKDDVSQVDPTFTSETPQLSMPADSDISNTMQEKFTDFTYVADSALDAD